MVDQRRTFSLISSWDHYRRFSPLRFSDTEQAGLKPAQNLHSNVVEIMLTTTPRFVFPICQMMGLGKTAVS